jgi:acetyl-CoA carboxylase biotin carboxylase subunit
VFKKILIANRGEIAVRIIRACKELGVSAAAVYSDADRTSLHTKLADESYYIGNSPSSESYLNKDKIIKLAKEIHAEAIHPGYGFFAENSDFIAEVEKEGLVYIGPSAKSVSMMGSKTAARELMSKNNVPIVPGTTKPIQTPEEGIKVAKEIGFPVLLKASAGGGGKGMTKVSSEKEFADSLESTARVAQKAFGSSEIYIEKFIENPKHIEVQVIADKFGNYAHLFERECSIQRRHQKIIEESPSSFVDEKTREKITQAAVNAAKACNYFNAGTIEFLMDANKNFYFLEMNTRIQVEHPVTEMITGIDLVKEQILIASGEKLSFKQENLKINGHALECRVYAEDPEHNFLPSTGTIYEYEIPSGPGIRLDNGLLSGSQISIHYDPLIAKLVCHAKNRDAAIKKMLNALDEYHIAGVINNISFLKLVLQNKNFRTGKFDINFIEKEIFSKDWKKQASDPEIENAAALFAALMKTKSVTQGGNGKSYYNKNKWTELIYE